MNLEQMIANQQTRLESRQELPPLPVIPPPPPKKDPSTDPENLLDLASAISRIVKRNKPVEISAADGQIVVVALMFLTGMVRMGRTCPSCLELHPECQDPWHTHVDQ